VTNVIFRFEDRPLWAWAAILRRLFDAPASGADWRPVISILATRYDDERGLRLAQKLCPGCKVRLARERVLAPTVLQRDSGVVEISDGIRTARLVAGLGQGRIAVEVGFDFADDKKAELAGLRLVARDVAKISTAGAAFVPHLERNLAGVPLPEVAATLEG
jgi:hypothetical protein